MYAYFYRYLENGDPILAKIKEVTNVDAFDVHAPYDDAEIIQIKLAKSYIWWSDDPWAALIALVGISILLCIAGIIVIIFTHSR